MRPLFRYSTGLLLLALNLSAQPWSLEISSTVDIRTLKLSNTVEKKDDPLAGASIALYQGSTIVKQVSSNSDGEFSISVPPNGEFMLVVSYQDYNQKRFAVNTKGVPPDISAGRYEPSFSIGGFIMAKPLYSIDYSVLKQALVKVLFMQSSKKFDDDEAYTNQMLDRLGGVAEAENVLIDKFVSANRAGDAALKKGDCPLAKLNYEKALALIPNEQYPKDQLLKVGQCLQEKEEQAKKQMAAAADKKAEEDKAAADKAAKDKAKKDKEEAEAAAKVKAAEEKAKKEEAEGAARARAAESERIAKENAAKSKAGSEKPSASSAPEPKKTEPAKQPEPEKPKKAPAATPAPEKKQEKKPEAAPEQQNKIVPKESPEPDKKKSKSKKGDSKHVIRPKL